MARYTSIILMLIGPAMVIGCASEEPILPAVDKQPAAPVEGSLSAKEPVRETLESANTEMGGVTVDQPRDPERILLFARGGPLLLDVWLTIDGRPHDEGLASLIERVLSAGDTDGDGRPTWSEWRTNQEFLQGELANLTPDQNRRVRVWIERFDENDDDQIQRTEAASWLGRDSGRSAAALILRSSRSYLSMASMTSRLWQLLDADGNGQLSADEIDLAPRRLLSLDTDNDRIIESPELASLRDLLDAQSAQRMTFPLRPTLHAAIHLENRSEADRLDYLLGNLYAPRQQLGPASFPDRARLFAALDDDGNQLLDVEELASLLEIEPHVKVSIDFASDAETGEAAAKLQVLEHARETGHVIQSTTNRVALVTSDTRLIISAHDLSGSQGVGQVVQRNQIRLMVHDRGDGLMEELDANADGRLGEREIASAADRMWDLDADGDRQLAGDELLYSMTVAFLRSESAGEQSFYVPRFVSAPVQEAATPPWFRHADFNSDGDVSRHEFVGSPAQFSVLDANQDGYISGDEAAGYKAP